MSRVRYAHACIFDLRSMVGSQRRAFARVQTSIDLDDITDARSELEDNLPSDAHPRAESIHDLDDDGQVNPRPAFFRANAECVNAVLRVVCMLGAISLGALAIIDMLSIGRDANNGTLNKGVLLQELRSATGSFLSSVNPPPSMATMPMDLAYLAGRVRWPPPSPYPSPPEGALATKASETSPLLPLQVPNAPPPPLAIGRKKKRKHHTTGDRESASTPGHVAAPAPLPSTPLMKSSFPAFPPAVLAPSAPPRLLFGKVSVAESDLCMQRLSATHVKERNEGQGLGTSDPQLWVYEGQANYETVQKTASVTNNLNPAWPETICVRTGDHSPVLHRRTDFRTCFDIRDDFDPRTPDFPPLLHFGCALLKPSWDRGIQSISLSGGATLHFMYMLSKPAPPPVPPSPPAPPTVPPASPHPLDVAQRLNERFRRGKPMEDITQAGILIHQFDSMDDPNPAGFPWIPGMGRHDTGDRISAALVFADMVPEPGANSIPIYSFDLAGIVLSPFHNKLLCAYPWDVGSLGRKCSPPGLSETCIPGCSPGRGHTTWCDLNNDMWPCAYRPSALAKVMTLRDEMSRSNRQPAHKKWQDGKFYDEVELKSATPMCNVYDVLH
ncbi:hypothetical protein AB1Y20_018795 [Prymnesium parvum]|uniref:C2 domain-containing protein n=1 Tax=Prymnesium parvum TaxID=97485 RepID=A0AB34JTB2_PRYPA